MKHMISLERNFSFQKMGKKTTSMAQTCHRPRVTSNSLVQLASLDQPITSHAWKEHNQIKDIAKTMAPLNTKPLKQVHEQKGPLEGTSEHKAGTELSWVR